MAIFQPALSCFNRYYCSDSITWSYNQNCALYVWKSRGSIWRNSVVSDLSNMLSNIATIITCRLRGSISLVIVQYSWSLLRIGPKARRWFQKLENNWHGNCSLLVGSLIKKVKCAYMFHYYLYVSAKCCVFEPAKTK